LGLIILPNNNRQHDLCQQRNKLRSKNMCHYKRYYEERQIDLQNILNNLREIEGMIPENHPECPLNINLIFNLKKK
jgi:hypothetical protein